MLIHRVKTILGVCEVRLERSGLDLGERGGFSAQWSSADEGLSLDAYRRIVKTHLTEVYRARHGRDPGGVALNLASFQLTDDLEGWAKLNSRGRARR